MKRFRIIYSYLRYLLQSKTRYVIHSPFVYELATKVLKDETRYPEYNMPKRTMRKYRKRTDEIESIDFGVRAGNNEFITFTTSIGRIVRQRSHSVSQLELLTRLSRYYKPKTILELGTAVGTSTLFIASGSPGSKIYTLEGCVGLASVARKCFKKRGLDNIEVIVGNFDSTLHNVLKEIKQLDFTFFDGNHRKTATLDYFQKCLPYAHEESIFIFDDIHWSAEMEEAWKQIKSNENVTVTVDLFWAGLVFFRKGQAKQDFIIRY